MRRALHVRPVERRPPGDAPKRELKRYLLPGGLALVLLTAGVLRLWALDHGIPFGLGVDEPEIMERAVRIMKTGDFNPRFYDYPSLYIYLQTGVAIIRFITGVLEGAWTSLAEADSADFYLWGRAVTALMGTATVWLVYRIGLRWSVTHAFLAATLLAAIPMHVRESHYVLTDVPLTFFVTLTLLLSLRAHEHGSGLAFAFAGAAAGMATATKYNGALSILIPLIVCVSARGPLPLWNRVVVGLAAFAGVFLVAAPYTILDLPSFLNGFARLAGEYRQVTPAADPIWLTYLKHLRINLRSPAAFLAAVGVLVAIVQSIRSADRTQWMLVLAFPLLYFWFISHQAIVFGRYLLPIVPFLAILVACGIITSVAIVARFATRPELARAMIVALALVAIAPPAIASIGFDRRISRRSTVDLAYTWLRHNVPPGSKVVVETRALLLPPMYAAENVAELRRKALERYHEDGVDYLIASSERYGQYLEKPGLFPQEHAEYVRLFAGVQEVARFEASVEQPGPELRILKIKRP